jgi:hypothetical protein
MIARPSVDQLLAGPLGGWLEQQTLAREEAKKQASNRLFIAGMIGLPLLAFVWILTPIGLELKLFGSAFAAMGAFAWSQAPKSKAKKAVKIGINSALAEALGIDYAHELQPGAAFAFCKKYELVPSYDREKFEDEWSGMLDGRRFRLFEAHLEEKRGSGKNQTWVTVFRGAILTIGFARAFHGTTLVQRAGQHRKLLGLGGRKDSVSFGGHRLDCVDLVHPQFADAFDVWSDDQVEARYLVHPAYVERLIALEESFHGQDIRALFTGGDVVIALKSENMFESGSIDATQDRARLEETIEQFGKLADLAEALDEKKHGAPPAPAAEPAAPASPLGVTADQLVPPAVRPIFGRKGLS